MENKLFEKISNIDRKNIDMNNMTKQPTNSVGRKLNDEVIRFTVNDDDPELVMFVKNLVNGEELTKSKLYDVVGPNVGYNMIYSLSRDKKPAVSWERVRVWLDVLNYDVDIIVRKKGE